MMFQGPRKREVEIDIVNPPEIDSVADLFEDSTKNELTILISGLMEGDDFGGLRLEYSSELVEDAISVLENRI